MSHWGEYPIAVLGLLGLVFLAASIKKRREGEEGFAGLLAAMGGAAAFLFAALLVVRAVEELAVALRLLGLP